MRMKLQKKNSNIIGETTLPRTMSGINFYEYANLENHGEYQNQNNNHSSN